MLKIDGVLIPTPVDFDVGIFELSKAERNTKGTMIKERIAIKRKIELGWEFLSPEEQQQILALVSRDFFSVDYPDPRTGNHRTGTFYAGDIANKGNIYKNGRMQWRDLKFNVIER